MPADEAAARQRGRADGVVPDPRGEDARSVADALHELTARFRLVLENAADVIVQYDADGQVLWASPSLRSTFGYDDTAVVGTHLRFEHPQDAGDAEAHVREVMRDGMDVIDNSHRVVHSDGSDRFATSRTRVVRDADGAVAYAVVTIRDVTEQVEAERALVASEAHFRMLADNATDLVLHTESSSGLIDWASPSALAILGLRPDELVGTRVSDLLHPEDLDRFRAWIGTTHETGRVVGGTEARFRRADGTWLWMSDSGRAILAADGTVIGGIDSLRDVSIEHEMREELGRQARRDALTGLPNRRDLLERLEAVLAHPPRAGTSTAVLFLDLDRLKDLNDRHGHRLGDAVLVEVGRRIRSALRGDDVVGRIAGDEYVVLLPSLAAPEDAWTVADAIHEQMSRPVDVDDVQVRATVSIGLTTARPGDRAEDVLHRADVALYRAKQGGRSRTEADVTDPVARTDAAGTPVPAPRESFTGVAETSRHER